MAVFRLDDGKELEPVHLHADIPVELLQEFVNSIIESGAYILLDKKLSLDEERQWFAGQMNKVYQDKTIHYVVFDEGKIIAGATADRGTGRDSDNVMLGIAIVKEYRGKGLGEQMLQFLIEKVKEKWKPNNIYLSVAKDNKPAHKLYKKLGFKEFAVFPKWLRYNEKYVDAIYLKL